MFITWKKVFHVLEYAHEQDQANSCLLTSYCKSCELGHVRSLSVSTVFVPITEKFITEKKCRAANATLNQFYDVLDDILSQNQTSNSTLRSQNINRVCYTIIWAIIRHSI